MGAAQNRDDHDRLHEQARRAPAELAPDAYGRADRRRSEDAQSHDTKICHNPGATLHGAYGAAVIGKFPEMLEMGITVAMGCDSSAANNSLDMFRTMYEVATVHKEIRLIPDLIPPEKALEMATVDGARALKWEKEIGSLEKGKKADVIIVETRRSNWIPMHDFSIVPNLVYSGEGADVESSIIDGKIGMENRKI